jgi:hypothetical protein
MALIKKRTLTPRLLEALWRNGPRICNNAVCNVRIASTTAPSPLAVVYANHDPRTRGAGEAR